MRSFKFVFALVVSFVLLGCNHSKEYHLKKGQQKTQQHEHKPAVKVINENLKNKDKNLKSSHKHQKKIQENQNTTKSKKKNREADFNFY